MQEVVEEPVPGRGLLGRAVVPVGQLHRVRPEQFVEAEAARPWFDQQVGAGQLGQQRPDLGSGQAGHTGRQGR